MYRSRHNEDLDRRALNFLSSVDIDDKILYYDILCTKAHVIMLYEIRLLNKDELASIVNELDRVLRHPQKLEKKGFEDIHEALETHLIRKIGVDVGGKVQSGRSRNDLIDILFHLINLVRLLLQKAGENLNSVMPLYTHLQEAQLGNFGHYLLSYCSALLRDVGRLISLYDSVNESPLGSGPIGGSTLPLNRRRTAKLLGFKKIISNTIDATSSRDFMIEFMSDITSIMITQSRIAQDIIIWSSQEFSFVEISDKHASSSSAMPQKKNPDPLELIRSKTAIVIGNLTGIMAILKSLPSGYTRDLQDTKVPFWNSIDITKSSLEIMKDIIDSLKIRKDEMAKASNSSYAISIDIAEALVMKERLPFRTAHLLVGSLVNKAFKKKSSLKSLDIGEIKEILQKLKISIAPDKLIRIIKETDSQRSLSLRRSLGSPNPKEQIKSLREYRMLLRKYFNLLQKRKHELESTIENLTKTINHIIKSNSGIKYK